MQHRTDQEHFDTNQSDSGLISYHCKFCDKTFLEKSDHEVHENTHIEEKPYKCNFCILVFSRKCDLDTHFKMHTGEKPFQCSQCDQTFSLKRYLEKHIRTHTEEKPYKCSLCEKSFKQQYSLKRHIMTHTGERPYQCSQCDKTFSRTDYLKKHTDEDHGENGYISSVNRTECIHLDCKETFYHKTKLIDHLIRDHKDEIEDVQLKFTSVEDFLTWKEAEESKNFTYYSKQTSTKKGKNASYMYYSCQKKCSSIPYMF